MHGKRTSTGPIIKVAQNINKNTETIKKNTQVTLTKVS